MYKVTNKMLDGLSMSDGSDVNFNSNFFNPEGEAILLQIAERLGMNVPTDDSGIDPDFIKLDEKIKNAITINWIAQETLKTKMPKSEKYDLKAQARKTNDINKFHQLFASGNMGISQLRPNETVDIVDDIDVINQLISSAYAIKIRIADANDVVVYDGGTVEYTYKTIKLDLNNKRIEENETAYRACNLLHPQKKNELYIKQDKSAK